MSFHALPREVQSALEDDGRDWGPYVLIRRVGIGGMGEVWRAWDKQLGRIVALKILKEITPEAVARFEREAQLAARLNHPNVATIYGVGIHNDRRYIAMRFIEGTTLEDSPLDLPALLSAIEDAAKAVAYAHSMGVIHRDINPRNIMLDTEGKGYVTDFGIAKWETAGGTVTQTGMVLGTPAYMSPEQAGGEPLDARTDVYSLGASLYYALTQSAPHYGDSPLQILKRVREDEPIAPRRLNPQIDRALEEIVHHAMQKEPVARYPKVNDLAADLRRYLRTEKIRGRPFMQRIRPRPHVRRRWIAAAVLAAAAGLGAFGWWVTHPPPPVVPPPPVDNLAAAHQVLSDFARIPAPTPDEIAGTRGRLATALDAVRDPSEASLIWGMFFWHADDRAESLLRIDEAIADDPENAVAHLWRARLLVRDYLRKRARWHMRVPLPLLLLLGSRSESERELAELARQAKASRASIGEYLRLSGAADAEASFAEGVKHFLDLENEQAEAPLQDATASTFLSNDAYLLLAIVRTYLGAWEAAEADLQRARGEGRDYILVRSMLALHAMFEWQANGSNTEALDALRQHLRVLLLDQPDHTKWELWANVNDRIRRDLEPTILFLKQ